jgi:hypothetical protein
MPTDSDKYNLTENLERWHDEDLLRYANDTEVMMGLEKFEVVKIAQELAWRYDDVAPTKGIAHEDNR